jgi:formylglycine-generating enzyme required for sulfatase activity
MEGKFSLSIWIRISVLIVLSGGLATSAWGQTVSDVAAIQEGQSIKVMYTLSGNTACDVQLYLSEDGGSTWKEVTSGLSGDVKNQSSGSHAILWDVLQTREQLVGSEVVFKVKVKKKGSALLGDFVKVEGGTFLMGSPNSEQNRGDDERQHEVTVSTFYMQATEVTQAMYESIMGVNPSAFKGPNRPVENVTWYDAQEFIKKLNVKEGSHYRLPTEAEWEYAARGGNQSKGYKYSGANDMGRVGWCDGNSGGQTHEVKGKQPNELGLYDLTGNVYEWCADWYGEYPNNGTINPKGPTNGPGRILRGGSWGSPARGCRVAIRGYPNPENRYNYGGFRLVFSE